MIKEKYFFHRGFVRLEDIILSVVQDTRLGGEGGYIYDKKYKNIKKTEQETQTNIKFRSG